MADLEKKNGPSFFAGVKTEFKKVKWPDRKALVRQTVAVSVASVVLGLVIVALDYFVQIGVEFLVAIR